MGNSKKLKKKPKLGPATYFRPPSAVRMALEERAEKENRSLSSLVVVWLTERLLDEGVRLP